MTNFWRNLIIVRNVHICRTLLRNEPNNLKGKKHSSQLWLTRQMRDPYVELAKQENYRCRSAFKLIEINERFKILTPGLVVVDCGAAPGSWTQVAVNFTNASGKENKPVGKVFAIDRLPIHPVPNATIFESMDFTTPASQAALRKALNEDMVDVVLSDMAPNATGVRELDHENIIQLAYSALKFALQVSRPGATFVTKVWDGGKSPQLENDISNFYRSVKIVRPQATRDESTEKFILAREFKGLKQKSQNSS